MGFSHPQTESGNMKVFLVGLVCASVALALPEGRRLRPEEHWRPAEARDISKYTPRHAMAPGAEGQTWEEHMIKITKAAKKISPKMASKMGSKYDMKAEVKAAGQQWKHVGVVSFGSSSGCEVGLP